MKFRNSILAAALVILTLAVSLALEAEPAHGAEFEVDNTTDNGALNGCLGAANDCSLRGAITKANLTPAMDDLVFPGLGTPGGPAFINVASDLPAITQPLFINGTNSGGGFIGIAPADVSSATDGLRIQASNVTILAIIIQFFPDDGIAITSATSVSIQSARIGVNSSGSMTAGNGGEGIGIISSSGITITNTIVGDSGDDGIDLESAVENVTIQGSYIGVSPASGDIGNGGDGIEVFGGDHQIGGDNPNERNYISGNGQYGIRVFGGSGTSIEGNFIGTNVAGTAAVTNDEAGIFVLGGADGTRIGGDTGLTPNVGCAGDCNLISGNGLTFRGSGDGVQLDEAVNTRILGNFIGTDVTGNVAIPNTGTGIDGGLVQGTQIGDQTFGHRNFISGNGGNGIAITGTPATGNAVRLNFVGTNRAGTAALPNGRSGIYIAAPDNIVSSNLISGNNGRGILVNNDASAGRAGLPIPAGSTPVDPDNNQIVANAIGLSRNGSMAIPNTEGGIELSGASNTTIGGAGGVGNYISGNGGPGLLITGGSQGSQVLGNYIGVAVGQSVAIPNASDGVWISDSPGNTIGGPASGRNVISGNAFHGVYITGEASAGNAIAGNYIGLGSNGASSVLNSGIGRGIQIDGAPGTTIGGTSSDLRNVISGNARGVSITGATAVGTVIQGNFIGTNADGTTGVGNRFQGVYLDNGVAGTLIGGEAPGAGNVISANEVGITLDDDVTDTTVQGNSIGIDALGAALGNSEQGIVVHQASDSHIGGVFNAANEIAFNGQQGVRVDEQAAGNHILVNTIHSNGGLGIDLLEDGGVQNAVTPNDAGDADTGSNNLQNFPVLTTVISGSGQTSIQGSLNSNPNTQYEMAFFISTDCDASGNGEGDDFIGLISLTTDGSGDVSFLATANTDIAEGQQMTVLATDLTTNDTSEYSACEIVQEGTPATPTPSPPGQTPTPTVVGSPTPTATPPGPTPTTTPTPTTVPGEFLQGDVDCNEIVDTVDALKELRHVASLSVIQEPGCPEIGSEVASLFGDVDCDDDVDSVDSLFILRFVAGLSVNVPKGCREIGT